MEVIIITKIIILDSGVDKEIIEKNPDVMLANFTDEQFDLNGHGTASYDLISKFSSQSEISVIKSFRQKFTMYI